MNVKDLMGTSIKTELEVVKVDHENQLFILTDGAESYALSFTHAEDSEEKITVSKRGSKTIMSCTSWRRAGRKSKWLRTDEANAKLDIDKLLEGL